jgi:EpsG family
MNQGFMIRLLYSLLFAVIIGLASGYQVFGISRDYENYFEFFDVVRNSLDYLSVNYRFEPGFTVLIFGFTRSELDNYLIYSLVVGIIVFIKYFSIDFSDKYWSALSVFSFYLISRYVVLFEMTVLRAACAFSLAFFVFFRKSTNSIRLMDIFILGVAVSFHYSAIVFFLIYFSNPRSGGKIILVAAAIFLAIYFAKNLALIYLPEYLSVFSTYHEFDVATFLPIPFAIDIVFLVFILLKFEVVDSAMRYAAMGMALSVAFHFSLTDYSIFASRFRELLSVFVLIYVVRAVYCTDSKVRDVSILYVILTGLMHLYVCFMYDPLLL